MTDKMMRIAGRTKEGVAKAIMVDNTGVLSTKEANYNYKEIMTDTTIASGEETVLNVLLEISGGLLGFNVKSSVQTSYTVSLEWRLGGSTKGVDVVETEKFEVSSVRSLNPVFIPVSSIKSGHLTVRVKNTGTVNSVFTVQEVIGTYRFKLPTKVEEQVFFGDVAFKTLNDTSEVVSNATDIKNFEDLEVYALNATYVPIEVKFTITLGNEDMLIGYYDWNKEEWTVKANNETFPGVAIPHARGLVRALSTHPDFYWLKELKATSIKIGVRPLAQPQPGGYVAFWIGGRKNVQ